MRRCRLERAPTGPGASDRKRPAPDTVSFGHPLHPPLEAGKAGTPPFTSAASSIKKKTCDKPDKFLSRSGTPLAFFITHNKGAIADPLHTYLPRNRSTLMQAQKRFKIVRLEERIAPSRCGFCCCGSHRGGSKKCGSHRGGSHCGGSRRCGSHRGGSHCGGSRRGGSHCGRRWC